MIYVMTHLIFIMAWLPLTILPAMVFVKIVIFIIVVTISLENTPLQ